MGDGESSEVVEGWILRLRGSLDLKQLSTPVEQTAFQSLLDQEGVRSAGRTVRLGEARSLVQDPIWFVLLLGGALTVPCEAMFIDRRNSFLVEAILMAATSALVVGSLLVVHFLDHPYADQSGSIKLIAMQESIHVLEQENRGLRLPRGAAHSGRHPPARVGPNRSCTRCRRRRSATPRSTS